MSLHAIGPQSSLDQQECPTDCDNEKTIAVARVTPRCFFKLFILTRIFVDSFNLLSRVEIRSELVLD